MLAVDYCHRKQVANRDIKLDNILLQANNNPNGRPLLKLCGAPGALVERGGACARILLTKCVNPQPRASRCLSNVIRLY